MNIKFFTWNVKRNTDPALYKKLNKHLIGAVIDVLIFQECYQKYPITELTDYEEFKEFLDHKGTRYVRIFLRKKGIVSGNLATSNLNNKIRCLKLTATDGYVFNLIAVHLYSKTGNEQIDQFELNFETGKLIREFEGRTGSFNTLVAGDLNHHPFDTNLQSTKIFTALNDKNLINVLKKRKFQSIDFPYYYNPMWNLLGDYQYGNNKNTKVPGSFYWLPTGTSEYHWNLFDGALVSSSMMDHIDMDTLEIVTVLDGQSLIDYAQVTHQNTIMSPGYSDHLPLQFSIKTT